jgi:hypothetical protein
LMNIYEPLFENVCNNPHQFKCDVGDKDTKEYLEAEEVLG